MRTVLLLLCFLLTFCTSNNQESLTGIPEPHTRSTIDSMLTGTYLGITIGDSTTKAYSRLQSLYLHDTIGPVSVVGNIIHDSRYLSYVTLHYTHLDCDSNTGTSDGVQFSFKDNTLASIYLNSGTQLLSWPENVSASLTINIGDSRSLVASKVDSLTKIPGIKNYLQRFSFFDKDMSTPADTFMLSHPEWYFARSISTDSLIVTSLFFSNQELYKIRNEYIKEYSQPH